MLAIRNYSCREHRPLLEGFAGLAETGRVPAGSSPGHNDGWGIGYYRHGRAAVHKSASSILREKDVFHRLLHEADRSPTLLVHLRKAAWPDSSQPEHAHPFLYENRMFAHNGTIADYRKLLPWLRVDKDPAEIGRALDTEVFFYFIMSRLPLGIEPALQRSIRDVCRGNSFSSLNFLLAGEKELFAYRQYSLDPSYYSLYRTRAGGSDVVCSEPVDGSLTWKMVRRGSLLVL